MRSFLLSCVVMVVLGAGAAHAQKGIDPSDVLSTLRTLPETRADFMTVEGERIIAADVGGYPFAVLFAGCRSRRVCEYFAFLSIWEQSFTGRSSLLNIANDWNNDTALTRASVFEGHLNLHHGVVALGGINSDNLKYNIGVWLTLSLELASAFSGRPTVEADDLKAPVAFLGVDDAATASLIGASVSQTLSKLEEQGLWTGHQINVIPPKAE